MNPFERHPDALENSAHPLVRHYEPTPLTPPDRKGGSNFVYNVKQHPELVAKINIRSVAQSLGYADLLGVDPTSNDEAYLETLRYELTYKRHLQEKLRKHFGREHVVHQRYFLRDVPLPERAHAELEALASFYPVPETAEVTEAKAIVAVQPRIPELQNPDRISLAAGVLEGKPGRLVKIIRDLSARQLYADINNTLMSAEAAAEANMELDDFLKLIDGEQLGFLLRQAESDAELRKTLRDFIERAVSYAEDTGEVMDFATDNVIFIPEPDNTWRYLIVDGFYDLQSHVLDSGQQGLRKNKLGLEHTKTEGNAMLQAVHFTRIVNGIGKLVGAKKFYTLLPTQDFGRKPDVLKLLTG